MQHVIIADGLQEGWSLYDDMWQDSLFIGNPADSWIRHRDGLICHINGRVDNLTIITTEQQVFGKRFDGQILVAGEDNHHKTMLRMYVQHSKALDDHRLSDPLTNWWPEWLVLPRAEYRYDLEDNRNLIKETLECLRKSLTHRR